MFAPLTLGPASDEVRPWHTVLPIRSLGAGEGMVSMPGMHETALSNEVTFPYGFPQPGDYRLFVQIKRNGRVQTGVFDAHVES